MRRPVPSRRTLDAIRNERERLRRPGPPERTALDEQRPSNTPRRLLIDLAGSAVAAGVAMALMSWGRALFQIRTLPERVMEASLLLVPPDQFERAIEQYGPAAKEYALYAATAGMFLGLVVVGVTSLRVARRARGLLAVGVALWLLAMVAIMPLTGGGLFGTALFQNAILINALFLAMALAYAAVLALTRAAESAAFPVPPPPTTGDDAGLETRRTILSALVATAASLAAVLIAGRSGGVKTSSLPLATIPPPASPAAPPLATAATPQPETAAVPSALTTAPSSAVVVSQQPAPTSAPPAGAKAEGSAVARPRAVDAATPAASEPSASAPQPAATAAPAPASPSTQAATATPPAQGPAAAASPASPPPTTVPADAYPVPPPERPLARDKDGALLAVNRPKGQWQPAVTANDDFYVVTKNAGGDPRIEARDWRLVVDGAVNRPVQLDYLTLRRLPSVTLYKSLECISNLTTKCDLTSFGCDLISTARWRGARLADVLALAGGLQSGVVAIAAIGADEFSSAIPVDAARDPGTMLVYEMNGVALPREHGFPVRMLIPGRYGMKNAKWLVNLKAMTQQYLDWYGQRSWSPLGIVKTMSRIDVPAPGAKLRPGTQPIAGIAYAGSRGISRVEFSIDGGTGWQAASLEPPLGQDTFYRWSATFEIAAGQTMQLISRATDGTGQLQTAQFSLPQPDGAAGWNSITVSA